MGVHAWGALDGCAWGTGWGIHVHVGIKLRHCILIIMLPNRGTEMRCISGWGRD